MKLSVHNLVKKYPGGFVLDVPELQIAPGESFGLVGNNGAGKTTFLRLILDLLQATEGTVFSNGKNVAKDESWKLYIGSYLDEGFIIDFLTPEEFFQFVGTTYGMSKSRVHEALHRFEAFFNGEVLGKKRKYIRAFSKGNIQKIGIAAAMLSDPSVLVLDEPFANLDPTSQIVLKKMLRRLHAEKEMTMLISSHNLNHVVEISSRIVLLERGKIVQDIKDIQDHEKVEKQLESYFSVRES